MVPEEIQGLIQLGFAALVAGWLIRWLTSTMQDTVKNNSKVVLGLQLYLGELYRLLLQHDAQIRGVNPTAGSDTTEAQRLATEVYNQAVLRLDSLKAQIEKQMDDVT